MENIQPVRTTGSRIAAGLLIAGALVLSWASTTIKYSFSSDPLGPRTFPFSLGVGLILCGIWYFLSPGQSEPSPDRDMLRKVISFLILAVVTTALMPYIGFITAMALLCGGLALLFSATPLMAVVSGIGQSLLWWSLFGPLLGGNLPVGPLGF